MSRELEKLRARIDRVDAKLFALLTERMRISRAIGILKLRLGLPIFQRTRLRTLLDSRESSARKLRLSPVFTRKLFKLIHDESLAAQRELSRRPAGKRKKT